MHNSLYETYFFRENNKFYSVCEQKAKIDGTDKNSFIKMPHSVCAMLLMNSTA